MMVSGSAWTHKGACSSDDMLRWAGLLLVYEVIAADMLAGKPGYEGLLCQALGTTRFCAWTCSRWAVTGLVTLVVLLPSVSARCADLSSFQSCAGS